MVWSQARGERVPASAAEFVEWKSHGTPFEDLNAWSWWLTGVSIRGTAEQLQVAPATPGYLPMLGYGHPLVLGRDFVQQEGTPGNGQVVIITHRIWRERFASDPNVLGQQIRIDRKPYTVVGVLAPGPPDENQSQLWVPLSFTAAELSQEQHRLLVMGRLKPGVTLQQANASLTVVAVINETLARQYFSNVDPLAQRIVMPQIVPGQWMPGPPVEWQVVGVRADIRSTDPAQDGVAAIDVPFWQSPWPFVRVAIRTPGDPAQVRPDLAAAIRSIDPDLPMGDVKTMEQMFSESLVSNRFNSALFGGFALAALLLAAVGIYGVMSFVVAQRTHEIGVRMALGADRARIVGRIVGEGMMTAGLGAAFGSLGAFYAARMLRGIVSGTIALDPMAFVIIVATLLLAALIACAVPAARAASVDPMVALRRD